VENGITIIYPPATLPTSPYSSLAYLKAGLSKSGIVATCIDINVEAYNYWLSSDFNKTLFELYEISEAKTFFRSSEETIINAKEYVKHKDSILNYFDHLNLEFSPQTLTFAGYLYHGFDFSYYGIEQLYLNEKDPIKRFYDFYFQSYVFNSNLIGISVTYDFQLIPSLLLSYYLKRKNPTITIILGGASLQYFKCFFLKNKWIFQLIDLISFGDGIDLITNYIYNNALLQDCILINSSNCIEYIKQSRNVDSLTSITPDYSGLQLEKYFTPRVTGIILTGIGCYYGKCSFCVPSRGKECKYILKAVSKIQAEINLVKHNLKTDLIFFGDDCLNIDHILKVLTTLNEPVFWQGEFRFEKNMDKNILSTIKKNGCLQILLGLESASQRVLNLMNKGIQIENVCRILNDCKYSHIRTNIQTIIGFPTETIEEAFSTVKFLYDNMDKINSCAVSPFSLYSGSDIHCNPKKYKIQISIDNYICEYIPEEGMSITEKNRLSFVFFESISEYIPANKFFLDGPMGNHAMIYYKNNLIL